MTEADALVNDRGSVSAGGGWSRVDRKCPGSRVKRGVLLSMQHGQSRPAADDLGVGWSNQYFSRYEIQKHH